MTTVLEENEFVWADSAYPVSSVSISRNIKHANIISLARNVGYSTIQKTRKGDTENEEFNNHCFKWFASGPEHAIGFSKADSLAETLAASNFR